MSLTLPPTPGIGQLVPTPPPLDGKGLADEFTSFGLSFAGGLALGLILAIGAMGIGLVLAFAGCRFFKMTLFAIAFLFGAALGFFIVMKIGGTPEVAMITAAILGLILGAIAIKVWKLSLFVLGGACGWIIWTVFKALFPDVLNTDALAYGVLCGIVLIMGLVAVKMEKIWLLLGTPLVGTFLFIQGVDYFMEPHLNVFQLLDTQTGCTFTECYILYSAVIGGWALGMFIQYRYTSEWGQKRRKEQAIKDKTKEEYEEKDRLRRKYRKREDSSSDED